MGKKGSWFSAIKRVFIPNGAERKGSKEIKNGRSWKLKHGESKSFIHFFFREPSSIERILEEADEEEKKKKLFLQPPSRIASFRITHYHRPEPTLQLYHHQSATKIQSAYRAYVARRSFRDLRGLMRLQGMVKGNNAKRQTINAMKMMQLLVRVQTQIQSRRIQMLENQPTNKNDKEFESSKWVHQEGMESMLQKKVEAIIKRERAMAYAYYSHQLWNSTPKMDIGRPKGYPWWWNWLERQLPPPSNTPDKSSMKNYNINGIGFNNLLTLTPSSTNSGFPMRRNNPFKPRARAADYAFGLHLQDDHDSLASCPPFSVPNYMTSTISTKAKLRASTRFLSPGTPITDSKKRVSFPLTPKFSYFKWNEDSNLMKILDQNQPLHAVGNTSINSTISMPAVVGGRRKPFNRFV